ncbi:MAG: heat-inducible transcriptional repressor HrcA [Firmicutes bacterium]|jgi:heat-inducible transcriptional repressor|nr:heat-inducible transcriptional repressor HrcA [Bacillota bacterium]
MSLGDRKLAILKIIIDDFINNASPVGSRTIAKKYPLGISSATVRNEMADLEELGYLSQPHTSAGRIPSELGYRMYVDSLIKEKNLKKDQRNLVRGLLLNNIIEVEDVISEAAEILSSMTGMIAMITLPKFNRSELSNLKFVKINDSKILMILVNNSGLYKSLIINFSDTNQNVLDLLSDMFVERLKGLSIHDINLRIINSLKNDLPQLSNIIDYLIPILRDTLKELEDIEICIKGKDNIFNIPEFRDFDKAKSFIESISSKKILEHLVNMNSEHDGLSVKIGTEIGIKEFQDISMVSSVYRFNEDNIGRLIILGPTRMDYSGVISIVKHTGDTLTEIFSGINL